MRNVKILFEDPHIIVCFKPAGIPVQTKSASTPDMESLLKNHLMRSPASSRPKRQPPYIGVIHRLDQPVSGLLVFAKTSDAARKLNQQLQSDSFGKYYTALICGTLPSPTGTLTDYLVKDGRTNTSRVCTPDTPNAKSASLSYETLRSYTDPDRTLIRIKLKTGRHHQIRVQMASAGAPLWGDTRYNPAFQPSSDCRSTRTTLALSATRLCFCHPVTGKPMEFELTQEELGWDFI